MKTAPYRPPLIHSIRRFEDPDLARQSMSTGPVVCIGTFDGVHRGQQAILATGLAIAKASGRELLVITFHPHPKSVVAPAHAPLLLTEPDEKVALLLSYGADLVLQLRFDRELAALSAAEFLDGILLKRLDAASIVIGHDFGFGRGRQGSPESMQEWGRDRSVEVVVVEAVTDALLNQRISSSLIRESLTSGLFDQAVRLLGHPYPVSGNVVRGAARGRQLGYPTWNLRLSELKLPPPVGIYSGWAGRRIPHPAMAYYGSNPTFGGEGLRLEAHLFDVREPHEAQPDQTETVWLSGYIRPEVQFDSAEELKRQLAEDERIVRNILLTEPTTKPQS
ncbi:MAG: riboflavin biosynthesis protein RibF [candidate division Zixibacteria bacterium]|nr:riboflavin biosynthesis protein RibF [candidate division Zixibacteria bacterium]